MKRKPRIFYLTEFPKSYVNRRWWLKSEKKRAEGFVKHIVDDYGIQGKVVKVLACK